ncbi:hypothetical protein BGX31_003208 [Mortierella sp. GBA43]|nr:hypothetical protein BGX31_003208 [Mortierella sp. GBA43]
MNNLLPLHSIMISYKGLGSSWFMRVSGQENKHNERRQKYRQLDDQDMHLDTYLLAPRGREIVLSSQKGKPLASHQISAPSKQYPTCFAKAVIGMQSRCTRPFCENLIGGSVLTESLRTKALDVLSPSMQQFQTTDPDIVHAPVGENVAVVSQDNYTIAKGESAPRSKIQVALLGRYGNTSIPNANMLELSLLEKGFSAKTIHFDHPSEISLAQAAQLFKSESILVAPQGDGLGYSTWMAPGTVVISILPRYTRSSNIYTDRMMAFGKRFFAWDCQDETCVQQDRDLAHECIEAIQNSFGDQSITAQDFEEFVTMKHDFRLRSEAWKAISDCYTRDVSRRINVDELTILIEDLAKDFSFVAPDAERKYRAEETKLTRRAVPEDTPEDVEEGEDEEDPDAATDPEENDEEAATDPEEDDKEAATDPEENDEEAEQDDKDTTSEDNGEPDEEDINVHEYDEVKAPPEEQDEDRPVPKHPVKPPAPPAHPALPAPPAQSGLPAPPPPPPPPAKPAPPPPAQPAPPAPEVNMPKTPYTPEVDLQHRVVRPIYGFVDFCKRGRCCGSAKISVREYIGTIGTKGLTPCAASMSTMVFGDKGVWRLTDQLGSTKETQSLVWQVDLARDLKKIAKL